MEEEIIGAEPLKILEVWKDETHVIEKDGLPYHVTPTYCPELWLQVKARTELE